MKRQIKSTLRTTIVYRMAELSDLRAWLIERAFADKLLLLAHSEDGVIWGRLEAGRITTAHDVFPKHRLADLEPGSLHTCRLFGESGELLVWRTRQGWAARLWPGACTEAGPVRASCWPVPQGQSCRVERGWSPEAVTHQERGEEVTGRRRGGDRAAPGDDWAAGAGWLGDAAARCQPRLAHSAAGSQFTG